MIGTAGPRTVARPASPARQATAAAARTIGREGRDRARAGEREAAALGRVVDGCELGAHRLAPGAARARQQGDRDVEVAAREVASSHCALRSRAVARAGLRAGAHERASSRPSPVRR